VTNSGLIDFSHHTTWNTRHNGWLGRNYFRKLVVGNAYGFGVMLHLTAESPDDLGEALRAFAQVPGVTGVVTLALRTVAG
jgi:hypothetical protein